MHRVKPQPQPRPDSLLKKPQEKTKPSTSKSKKLLQVHGSLMKLSPYSISTCLKEKQYLDVGQMALRIISAAAENREKQILLSLAMQMEKQHKLRNFMLQKQSMSEISQLSTMLNHLHQQQSKQLTSLKVQIGKRKLKNLDQHDLRQDLLNLNSYIMRRSKNDSLMIKNQGVDLIAQIYNKFDQQARIIGELIGSCQKNLKRFREYKGCGWSMDEQYQGQKNVKLKQRKNGENCFVGSSQSSPGEPGEKNVQLLGRMIDIEKQNIRLSKQLKKIEQQFECVVQQKLLLEDKYERYRQGEKSKKKKMYQFVQMVREKIGQFRDVHDYRKQQVNQLMNCFQSEIQSAQYEIREFVMSQRSSRGTESNSAINIFQNSHSLSNSQPNSTTSVLDSGLLPQHFSQNALAEHYYQQFITQKQLQINHYLKMIAHLNGQLGKLVSKVEQQKKIKQRRKFGNMLIREKIKEVRNEIVGSREAVEMFKKKIMEDNEQFYLQFQQKAKKAIAQQFTQLHNQIQTFQIQSNTQSSALSDKQHELFQLKQQISQITIQLTTTTQQIQNQQVSHQRQKQQLIGETEELSNNLALEKQKYHSTIQHIVNLQHILKESKQENKKWEIQNHLLKTQLTKQSQSNTNETTKLKQQISNLQQTIIAITYEKTQLATQYNNQLIQLNNLQKQNIQTMTQITSIKQQNNQLSQKNTQFQTKLLQKQKQLIQMANQYQNFKDATISQCGMILQSKTQELLSMRLQVERENLRKEDIQATFRQFILKNRQMGDKSKYETMLRMVERTNNIKCKVSSMKQNHQYMSECIHTFFAFFLPIIKDLLHKTNQIVSHQYLLPNIPSTQISIQTSPPPLKLHSQVILISYLPSQPISTLQHSTNTIVTLLLEICDSIELFLLSTQLHEGALGELLPKIQEWKQKLGRWRGRREGQKMENGNVMDGKENQEEDISGNLMVDSVHVQSYQLNNIPIESQPTKNISSQLTPEQHFHLQQHINTINLMDILDESLISDQVTTLKSQLANYLKLNEKLSSQLLFYQQKDMDKIFDF